MSSTNEYENEWGETIVHWSKQDNPFFAQLPIVHIARAVRKLGDDEVTTPDTQCHRVFSRVRNHRVDMNVMDGPDLLAQRGSLAMQHSYYDLLPFDAVFEPPVGGLVVRAYAYKYVGEDTALTLDLPSDYEHITTADSIEHKFYKNAIPDGVIPYLQPTVPEESSRTVTLYVGDSSLSPEENLALTWTFTATPAIPSVLVETVASTEDSTYLASAFPGQGVEQFVEPPTYQLMFFSISSLWTDVQRTYELKSSAGHVIPVTITRTP